MATQTNVKFSRLTMPVADALVAVRDRAFKALRIELGTSRASSPRAK